MTGSATRRRTLSAIKALLSTGFKMGALRFNVGAALRLPAVVSRRAERRLEEIELDKLLTVLENHPRNRAIIEALYGTGARVEELAQLKRWQLVADLEGAGGYVTLYGKHGARTIRVSPRTWAALQRLAEGKEPDDPIVTITDERIRQILTAAAQAATCAWVARASAGSPGGHDSRYARALRRSARRISTSVLRHPTGRVCT